MDTNANLGELTIGCRLAFKWMTFRRSIGTQNIRRAALEFGALPDRMSATKLILNTKNPVVKKVNAAKTAIRTAWVSTTIPIPGEDGIRLIRRDRVQTFQAQFDELHQVLTDAVGELAEHYQDLVNEARISLGTLFNPEDYPPNLTGEFDVELSFPSVIPPDYLSQVAPEIYERERLRVAAQLEAAARLAEQEFIEEFSEMVRHLLDRLDGGKIFRDSSVEKFRDFFAKVREWNLTTDPHFQQALDVASAALNGVKPDELRNNFGTRQFVREAMERVEQVLSESLVDRPRRKLAIV